MCEESSSLRNLVYCRVDDGPAFVLASLRNETREDVALDLVFEADKKLSLFATGPGEVHLTGYHVAHFIEQQATEGEEAEEADEQLVRHRQEEPPRKRVKYNDPLGLGELASSDEDEEAQGQQGTAASGVNEDEEDEEEDEDLDPNHPMKPKSLLAALIAEETMEDEEGDENFVLGDTAEEDAADAEAQRRMEQELRIKHRDYTVDPEQHHQEEQQQDEEEQESNGIIDAAR